MKNIRTEFLYFLPMTLLAFIVMFIYTRSSPLYFTNNSVDANAYMTMGKGIIHGLTPYKDLFEQKGPVLYYLHALAYLIYPNTFYGIYIFQSIAMALTMIFFYKIARLFVSKLYAYLFSFFLPAIILNIAYFEMGDSAEEFAIPCVMFLIYSVLSSMNNNEFAFSKRTLFIHGALLACTFWTKYTLIGAWVGFFSFYGIYLLWKKQFSTFLQTFIISLAGFFLVSLLVLAYFGINHALGDLYEVYFKFNMTSYPNNTNILIRIAQSFGFLLLFFDRYIGLLFLIGIVLIFFCNRKKGYHIVSILFIAVFFATGFCQYLVNKYYSYYFLIIVPFTTIGLIGLAWQLEQIVVFKEKYRRIIFLSAAFAAIVLPFYHNDNPLYSRLFPGNSDQIVKSPMNSNQHSSLSAQREFAKIINKVPNATLLNYGFLDCGFYLAADIVPNMRYFIKLNIDDELYPEMQRAQEEYIKEKKVDFVVVVEDHYKHTCFLDENYRLVAVHLQTREKAVERAKKKVEKYLLFQRIEE